MYDERKTVDVIYLDFQKVFDKVPHRRLLTKLVIWYRWGCTSMDRKLINWPKTEL